MFPLPLLQEPKANRSINRFDPRPRAPARVVSFSIFQPFSTGSAKGVPRDRGVRGAARFFSRELKGIGATQEDAKWQKAVSFSCS
jgi:hypothetical protein